MIAILGEVDIPKAVDYFIEMTKDSTIKHEYNVDKKFMHDGGWGVVYTQDNDTKLHKSIKPVYEDDLEELKKCKIHLLHARKATTDKISLENTHPFDAEKNGKKLYFCHNGTIRDEMEIEGAKGNTDSEKFFLKLAKTFDPYSDVLGIQRVLRTIIDYSSINSFLLSDD